MDTALSETEIEVDLLEAKLWSEKSPNLYCCLVTLNNGEQAETRFGIRKVEWSNKGLFINRENTEGHRLLSAVMGLNLVYAVFNGAIGIINQSAWCGSLAAYYMLLSVMRFLSVSYARKLYDGKFLFRKEHLNRNHSNDNIDNLEARSRKVYRNCGIMLSVSSIALAGAVIMLVYGEGGKTYPDLMIYGVAAYTFYKLTMAVLI